MSDDRQRFFSCLFGRATEGSAVLWTLPDRASYHHPFDPKKLDLEASRLDALGRDVFVGLLPRKPGTSQKGGSADVLSGSFLWLDLDIGQDGHAAKNCPPDLASAGQIVAHLPDPSISVWTGGGLHLYWLLSQPVAPFDLALACRRLQESVIERAKPLGWHVDLTAKADCVLRVPGTTNKKREPHRPCEVLELVADRVYNLASIVPAASASAPSRLSLSGPTSPPYGDATGTIDARLSADKSEQHVLEGLRQVMNDKTKGLAQAILRGLPLEPGSRDNELTRAAGLVAALAPEGAEAEDIIGVLVPMVEATIAQGVDPRNPPPTYEDALDKLHRSLSQWKKKRAVEKASSESLEKAFIRAARASARASHEDPDDALDRPYSADEIRQFEADHGTPLQWLVQNAGAHYVLVGGQYQGPIVNTDLSVNLRRTLSPAPLSLMNYDVNPPRRRTALEILEKYSTDADRVVADLSLSRSEWNPADRVFREACAPLRRIAPQYDPQINTWLELLGGEHASSLLDWIAALTRLDRQCAALYLSKCPGTGKTMLSNGLARVWYDAPTQLKNIVGSWNSDIARCPLIVADEYLPPSWTAQRGTASSELRELVGSDARTLTRKFLPNVPLKGAVRVMLLTNNKNMLPIDESLGSEDLAAIKGRFLHIRTSSAAARYLESLGGPEGGTKGWVAGDKIAAHALWLRDNRQVDFSGRFAVGGGDSSSVHDDLVIETKIGSLVCEVIARILADVSMLKGPVAPLRAGGGRLLVSTAGVADKWQYCIKSDPVQSTHRIGRQLSLMSDGVHERKNGQPYYNVNPEYVFRWAERYLVGDIDAMRTKIAAPMPTATVIEMPRRGAGSTQGENDAAQEEAR